VIGIVAAWLVTGPVMNYTPTTAAGARHAAQHFAYRPVPAVEARQFSPSVRATGWQGWLIAVHEQRHWRRPLGGT